MTGARKTAMWGLVPLLLLTMTNSVSADTFGVGFVTCIPANSDPSCVDPAASGQARWRVVNGLSTELGRPQDIDLFDVTLDFQFSGGARVWHWDVVHPGRAFVETDFFDRGLIAKMTQLSLTATLAVPELPTGNRYMPFVLSTPVVSGTESRFPPPLDVLAHGDFVSRPTPEPASLILIGTGAMGLGLRRRTRTRKPQ